MLDYIEKYKKLPKEVRNFISNESNMGKIESLEEKFSVDLAPLVIKVAVGDVATEDVFDYLKENFDLSEADCMNISQDLSTNVFNPVFDILEKQDQDKNATKEEEGVGKTQNKNEKKMFLPKFKKRKRLEAYDHDHDEEDIDLMQEENTGDSEEDHFNQEDQEDLNQVSENIDSESLKKKKDKDKKTQEALDSIIKKVGISFSSSATKERFRKIIGTYLIGVRSKSKTRLTLSKEFDKGGLGLGNKVVDKILDISGQYLSDGSDLAGVDKKKENKSQSSERKESGASLDEPYFDTQKKEKKSIDLNGMPNRDIDYDLSALRKKVKQVKADIEKKKADKKKTKASSREEVGPKKEEEKYNLSEVLNSNFSKEESGGGSEDKSNKKNKEKEDRGGADKKEASRQKEEKTQGKDEDKKGSLKDFFQSESKRKKEEKKSKKIDRGTKRTGQDGGKKVVDDIKKAPRLVNPVSELKYMDLIKFRRLGRSAKDRANKIMEKINYLEQKYYYRKIQGIKAWRESPVNKMYIKMGQESIFQGKPIDDIIKQRKKDGKDFLNKEEFHAIMDLNDQLRKF